MSSLLVALIASLSTPAFAYDADECGVYGDLTGDGVVDVLDVACSNRLQFDATDDCYAWTDPTCADVDCVPWVYTVTALDTAIITQLVAGAPLPGDFDGDGILDTCQPDEDDRGR